MIARLCSPLGDVVSNVRTFGLSSATHDAVLRTLNRIAYTRVLKCVVVAAVPAADGKAQAPHILVVIFARGLLRQLVTRIYFDGEASNAADPALARCGARAATLVASRDGADAYAWNISLQGMNETVFFEA